MYSPTSLAVRGAAHFASLADKVLPRIHRKLDARFQIMDEALAVLEARPVDSFPTIHKSSSRLLSAGTGATFTTILTGVNLGDDVVATLGGFAVTVVSNSDTSISLSVSKASLSLVVDSLLVLDVSVGGLRCNPIDMIVVT